MSSFVKQVFDEFANLTNQHGFIPAKAVSGKWFASFLRTCTLKTFVYLFVRDERSGSGSLNVQLWVAPLELPDDTLENLGIGYKILMGATYEPTESFFHGMEQRILNVLPGLEGLARAVETELQTPPFPTKRLTVHEYQKQAVRELIQFTARTSVADGHGILEYAQKLAAGKGNLAELEKKIKDFLPSWRSQGCFSKETKEFFGEDTNFLSVSLARRLYVEELGKRASLS